MRKINKELLKENTFELKLEEILGYDPSKNTEIKFESYTINELLERAIEKEKYSSKFYRTMAERADEDTFSNILSYLAYVENEHRNVLQKELSGRK